MKRTALILLSAFMAVTTATMAQAPKKDNNLSEKVKQYARMPLRADLGMLTPKEHELIKLFIDISNIMDNIYWEQVFGEENHRKLRDIKDPAAQEYARINYGAWDRMDNDKPFLAGYKEKPAGANFYPADMSKEEFEKLDNAEKDSPYTVIRRDEKGHLQVIPYHIAYRKHLKRVNELLDRAISICDNDEMRTYLIERRNALNSDNYYESDLTWMKMKKSNIDFVFGPIENYDDALYGRKTAYEAFVLVKNREWSDRLERFTPMLPEMQSLLPCDKEYKEEMPGRNSDINVYDVVYYAGECNAAGKTIAINLPNDERVHLEMGTRRLQLKNAMEAKFETIMRPIAELMIGKEQIQHVKFDAFFNNVCFHEVAHGLGVKHVINDKKSVREALQNQYSAWEEAKADICGLFIVQTLIERGEIEEISLEDAYVTFMAGLLRSVRFGANEAHGKANIMCFNYMQSRRAFNRSKDGRYSVDMKKMREALEGWAALVLKMEGDGDYEEAQKYANKNGIIGETLANDLKAIEKAGIPIDIVFDQGFEVLELGGPMRNPLEKPAQIRQMEPVMK